MTATHRICTTCGEPKPLSEFYKRTHTAGSYSHQCKLCKKLATIKNAPRYCADCREPLERGDRHMRCPKCAPKRANAIQGECNVRYKNNKLPHEYRLQPLTAEFLETLEA